MAQSLQILPAFLRKSKIQQKVKGQNRGNKTIMPKVVESMMTNKS